MPQLLVKYGGCNAAMTETWAVLCLATLNGTCVSASKIRCTGLPTCATSILNGG